jgi:hypothetical protein
VQISSTGNVLYAGTYTSGASVTGSAGNTCTLSSFNGGGSSATATVALTGSNALAGGTSIVVTAGGSGYTSAPTSATLGSGTATCSGTVVVATILGALVADPGGASYMQTCAYSGGCIFDAPAGTVGYQRLYRNATGDSGQITVQMPTSNTVDFVGANGSSAGYLISGGALGDSIFIWSDASNHWYASALSGNWTNH